MECKICHKETKYSDICKSCSNKERYKNPEYRKHFSDLLKKAWKDRDWTKRNKKISEALTGKKLTEEHKNKLSLVHKGKLPTKEAKLKMSYAQFKRQGGEKYKKNVNGYVTVFMPEHPDTNSQGRVYEHRLIMENKIGRRLKKEEVVHHLNRKKDDNREDNLYITYKNLHKELEVVLLSCPKCNYKFNVFVG